MQSLRNPEKLACYIHIYTFSDRVVSGTLIFLFSFRLSAPTACAVYVTRKDVVELSLSLPFEILSGQDPILISFPSSIVVERLLRKKHMIVKLLNKR